MTQLKRKGKRARVEIDPDDEKRLLKALEVWAQTGDFVALRTRAFALLLWDGAVRTKVALALNAEDVVKDPSARRVTVRDSVMQRPCEANRYRARSFYLSARTQDALADYLRAVREGGWLPTERLQGALFISSFHRGTGQRLSDRSAAHNWEAFQGGRAWQCSRVYQLEDIVYAGRLAYVEAAGGSSGALSDHSGISKRWAAEYERDSQLNPEDVIKKLHKRR